MVDEIIETDNEVINDKKKQEELSSNSINKKCECPYITGKPFSLRTIVHIVYICQALSFLFGITAVFGVILNYLRKDEVTEEWLKSHFIWQIRTFWFGFGVAIIGYFLTSVVVGFLILAINMVWIIYRVIKGWLLLYEGKKIGDSSALI